MFTIIYDTKFIFAEVNADQVYWQKKVDSRGKEDWAAIKIKTDAVGHMISTKSPHSAWRGDVTLDYKYL